MFIITNESDVTNIDNKYDVREIVYTEEEVRDYLEADEHSSGDEPIYVHEFSHVRSLSVEVVTEYNLTRMF